MTKRYDDNAWTAIGDTVPDTLLLDDAIWELLETPDYAATEEVFNPLWCYLSHFGMSEWLK